MANRFYVGGTGNWSDTAHWSTTSGGAGGTAAPLAGDIAILDSSSGTGTVTVTSGAVCRRLECSGVAGVTPYAGTLAFTNVLTIGDGVNGAYTFVAGMTVSGTAGITLANTVTAPTNLTSGGKVLPPLTFSGTGGGWTFADAHTVTLGTGTIAHVRGTLNTNGQTVVCSVFNSDQTNTRTLTLGASSITCSGAGTPWNIKTTTNLTFNANTSTITLPTAATAFQGGDLTYNNVVFSGSGTQSIYGANTFVNFTRNGTASQVNWFSVSGNQTITGTLTLSGNSATNRLLVRGAHADSGGLGGAVGTVQTITSAANVFSNLDFQDITGAGAASWNLAAITGNSGDCGGNSGITFTTPATQTWSGTSGGNWSANAWTSRVPLPQDDVVISAAFSASQTITADMPRLGKNISFTGVTGSPALTVDVGTPGVGSAVFGSLTLAAGLGTVTLTTALTLAGYSSHTLTSAGKAFAGTSVLQVTANGAGTYTLQDDLTITATSGLQVLQGTFTANDFNITTLTVFLGQFLTSVAPTVNMGAGTWSITSTATATVWNVGTSTINAGTSAIVIANASANTRTFAGGGKTYNTLTYTVAGSTGQLTVTGANTFATLNFSDASNARTLVLPSSTTTTITNSFNVNGTSGALMSVNSSSAGTAATLSKSSGTVLVDYASIKDSTVTGGATWRALHSTDVSGNTGWAFTWGDTVTAGVVATVASVPTPTLATGSTVTAVVVSASTTLPAPTISTGVTVAPAAVLATTTVNAPTISTGSTATPAVVQATTSVATPTVDTTIQLAPAAVTATTSVTGPGIGTGLTATVIQGSTTVPAPTVDTQTVVSPSVVTGTSSVGAPELGAGVGVSPSTCSTTGTFPAPALSTGVTVSPAVVTATATVAEPGIQAEGHANVSPAVVNTAASVPGPSPGAGATTSPVVVQAVTTVDGITFNAEATATPASVVATSAVGAPENATGVTLAPAVVTATTALPGITLDSSIAPEVLAVVSSVNAPTFSTGAGTSPTTIQLTVEIPGASGLTVDAPPSWGYVRASDAPVPTLTSSEAVVGVSSSEAMSGGLVIGEV